MLHATGFIRGGFIRGGFIRSGSIVGCLVVCSCGAGDDASFAQTGEPLLLTSDQPDQAPRPIARKRRRALGSAARHATASHRRWGKRHHHTRHCHGGSGSSPSCGLSVVDGTVLSGCSALTGGAYTYRDEVGSLIDLTDAATQLCVAGHATRVVDEQWDLYWGAGLGIWLAQETDEETLPFDATAEGVVGLGFALSGAPGGGQLRLDLGTTDNDGLYCSPQWLEEGYNEVLFADIYENCWETGGSTVDPSRLEHIQWQVVTNLDFDFDFDFCVSDIKLLK